MSKNELKFRIGYFWHVFKVWLRGVIMHRTPKGMRVKKHLITYGIVVDEIQVESQEGTIWDFLKWIIAHDSFDKLYGDRES